MLDRYNEAFGIHGVLKFTEGEGGFTFAEINNGQAQARICLHGAHIVSYQPHGTEPVIWLSKKSLFAKGTAIRGGIPICWPWFGVHPSDTAMPNHGFVRNRNWSVLSSQQGEGGTEITFILEPSGATNKFWDFPFQVHLKVTVGASLKIELITKNVSDEIITVGGAFHSYFNVKDIENTTLSGLDGTTYIDEVGPPSEVVQKGDLCFKKNVDRVYLKTSSTCVINDLGHNRQICIQKTGSQSTVIWNPWDKICQGMKDMAPDSFKTMLCVETTNACDDLYTLAPNETHNLSAVITTSKN